MKKVLYQIQSDKIKLSKTSFFILHLAIPVIGLLFFLGYLSITKAQLMSVTIGFLQLLSIIYPVIIALVTSVLCEQEIEAGGGFFILSVQSRARVLLSKIVFLLLGSIFACGFLGIGYGLLAPIIREEYTFTMSQLLMKMLIISGCSIFLYGLHLGIGLKFGRNVNFAISVMEVLLSALMLTGLGDTLWFFLPCAWGARLSSISMDNSIIQGNSLFITMQKTMPTFIIITTLLLFLCLFLWFNRWEGRKSDDE